MNVLREMGLLTMRSIRAAKRNPVFLFMGVAVPIIYLALFAPLLRTLLAHRLIDAGQCTHAICSGNAPYYRIFYRPFYRLWHDQRDPLRGLGALPRHSR